MKDPYEILGIASSASEDEIREAYRELARRYHPDNHKENPLADLAEEKMAEINDAYDEIIKQRRQSTSSSSNQHGGLYQEIRALIADDQLKEAQRLLEGVSQALRTAEWYYVSGLLMQRRGWLADARASFEEAVRRDPSNEEYRRAVQPQGFNTPPRAEGPYATTCCLPMGGGCEFCTSMLCANMLCNCCLR